MDIRPNSPTALIVGNGETPSQTLLDQFWSTVDLRIGADGGANRLLSLGLKPDFVVGDLDSLTEANRKQFQASQLHLVTDQETNDVSKVLEFCHQRGIKWVHLLGMQGDRTDHFMACLDSCYGFRNLLEISLWNETERIDLSTGRWSAVLPVGTTVSLIPAFGPVTEITSWGLGYALAGRSLHPGQPPSGVSNLSVEPDVRIEFAGGTLLVVTQRKQIE
ncbi:MAG: thiamine diphosphokinase [bacterium]